MMFEVILRNTEGESLVGLTDNLFDAKCIAPIYECDGMVTIEKSVRMATWEGRHDIPDAVDGPVFLESDSEYITDPDTLEELAFYKLREMEVDHLHLYITGLTVAVLAIINACRVLNIRVTTWHYDRDYEDYFPYNIK